MYCPYFSSLSNVERAREPGYPFNPETKIEYTLAKDGEVNLTIYDLRGGQVVRFVKGEQKVGNYDVTWNASGMATGIYFYRLQAGNFVQTRKMVLLK